MSKEFEHFIDFCYYLLSVHEVFQCKTSALYGYLTALEDNDDLLGLSRNEKDLMDDIIWTFPRMGFFEANDFLRHIRQDFSGDPK